MRESVRGSARAVVETIACIVFGVAVVRAPDDKNRSIAASIEPNRWMHAMLQLINKKKVVDRN